MIIYKLTNIVNGKEYVGKTTGELVDRWKEHVADANRDSGRLICRAIKKYGEGNFTKTIIDTAINEEGLNKKEKEWITKLNTCVAVGGIGYNMTLGGEGISGLKRTDEFKEMMSKKYLGREIPWADKVSVGMKKVFAENEIVREQILGNIDKMCEGNKKAIEALIDGAWVSFEAIKDFCDKYDAASPNVLEVLTGKTNTIKGFKVRWVDLEARALADKRIADRKNKKGTHKAVRCIETGEIFVNGLTAAKTFNIRVNSVYYSIKNGWACKLPKQNEKIHFELVK